MKLEALTFKGGVHFDGFKSLSNQKPWVVAKAPSVVTIAMHQIGKIREKTYGSGSIATEATDPEEKSPYEMYYDSVERLAKIPNHRVLAINILGTGIAGI